MGSFADNRNFYVGIIVVLAAIIGLLAWLQFGNKNNYYAVYLTSGDLYFGRLETFPTFSMDNAYLLQVDPKNTQNPYSLSSFSNAFWKPEGSIEFNRSNVLWMAKISAASPLSSLIANPSSANALPQAPALPSSASTSTNVQPVPALPKK